MSTTAQTPAGGRLTGAIGAEWTKLISVRSTWWCLLSGIALMAVSSAILGIDADPEGGLPSATEIAVGSAQLAQFGILALAMLVITGEYASGSIRSSLLWVPVRRRILLAKIVVVAPLTFVLGTLMWAVGIVAAWIPLGEDAGVRAAAVPGQLLAVGTYLALVSVFTLGVGLAVRSAVGTMTIVFVLLMVAPFVLPEFVADYLPGSAGLSLLDGSGEPYGRVIAFVVLVAWAVAAQLVGGAVLRKRDA